MIKAKIVSLDEEFEKSRVKAHVRTRKGKLERVKEYSRYLDKDKYGLTLGMRNILRQAGNKVIHTTGFIRMEDTKHYWELRNKGFLEYLGPEGRTSSPKFRITETGKQLVKVIGKKLED
jgi:hypothetical protein